MADPLAIGQSEDVALVIDGEAWRGWTGVQIERYIDAMSGAFRLDLTTKWFDIQVSRPIAPGMWADLTIGGETVITGRIRDVEPSYDAHSNGVAVVGHDATHRLVTCSALPRQYAGASLFDVITDIAAPFGVFVVSQAALGAPLSRFVVEDGETAFEAIDRACRMRGVLPTTNGAGQLLLTRAGQGGATAAVRGGWGGNVLSATGRYTDDGRFNEIVVKAQRPGTDDDADESAAAHVIAEAVDDGVSGYAPLIIIAGDPLDTAAAQMRADWERSVRRGRARRVSATVQGWRDGDGALWRVNTLVPYQDSILQVDAELLVAAVQFSRDDRGTLTTLQLVDPQAFTPDPQGEIEIGWGGAVPPKPVARPLW